MTSSSAPRARFVPAARGLRSWALLLVLAGNMLIDAFEVSIPLLALPLIGDGLGLSRTTLPWILAGFAAGFAALLLLGPRIAARFGRRRVYLIALGVFIAASLVGGMTDSAVLLVATRFVKGACAALTAPIGMAVVMSAFPEGRERRRAISVYSFFGAFGFTAGLLLSAALTSVDWNWTLSFPAVIALVLLVPAFLVLPRDPDGATPRRRPRGSPWANGPLLRSALCAAALNGTHLSLMFVLVLQFHTRSGWGPWTCAVALLPACLPLLAASPFTAPVVTRVGAPRLMVLGALSATAGYALYLPRAEPGPYLSGILPTLLLVGLAFVLSFTALQVHSVSRVSNAERGEAVPYYQAAVQLGAVVLLPATGALLSTAEGHHRALLLLVGVAAGGTLVALSALWSRAGSVRAA